MFFLLILAFFLNEQIPHYEEAKAIFNDKSTIFNGSIYKIQFNALWQKVFYHHSVLKTDCFVNEPEVLNVNALKKYSILSQLDKPIFRINGLYEFLLEYPDHGYNRWKQSDNPATTVRIVDQFVHDYHDVNSQLIDSTWGGLAISSTRRDTCMITGSITAINWFYCIGMFANGANEYNGKIPAAFSTTQIQTNYVNLWVRINDPSLPFSKLMKKDLNPLKEARKFLMKFSLSLYFFL